MRSDRTDYTNVLIDAIISLGYTNISRAGICAGLTQMWVNAALVGEEDKFLERIKTIATMTDMKAQIESVKLKVKERAQLTPQQNTLLQLKPFFDGIVSYQSAALLNDFFGIGTQQRDVEKISTFIMSEKLAVEGGRKKIYSDVSSLTQEELQKYFTGIKNLFKDISNDIVFTISNGSHIIGLQYNNEKNGWVLIDSHRLDENIDERFVVTSNIAYYIATALSRTLESTYHCGINVYSTNEFYNQNQRLFEDKIQELEKISEINSNNISTEKSVKMYLDISLAYLAILQGNEKVISKLVDDQKSNPQLDLHLKNENLLHYAVLAHHPKIIPLLSDLLKNEINFLEKNDAPIHLAARNGYIDIIDELEKVPGIDLTLGEGLHGYTALQIAIEKGHIDIALKLAKHAQICKKPDNDGKTPAHFAVEHNQIAVISAIAKMDVNFFQKDNSGVTPVDIAIKNKNWMLVVHMLIAPKNDIGNIEFNKFSTITTQLTDEFIKFIKSLPNEEEKSQHIEKILNKENALSVILSKNPTRNPSDFFKLFKSPEFNGKKISANMDRILSSFPDILPKLKMHL